MCDMIQLTAASKPLLLVLKAAFLQPFTSNPMPNNCSTIAGSGTTAAGAAPTAPEPLAPEAEYADAAVAE